MEAVTDSGNLTITPLETVGHVLSFDGIGAIKVGGGKRGRDSSI